MSAQIFHDESDPLPTETMDVVVIGGGAAGLNGALMPARSRRSVVVIDSGTPGNAPAAAKHGSIVLDGTPPPRSSSAGAGRYASTAARSSSGTSPWPDPPPPPRTVTCGSPSPWPTAAP